MSVETLSDPSLLINADYEKFAPPYTPETFTPQEQLFLKPFFSNLDRPVFTIHALPQEVMGALASRYSRAESGLRRVFMRDYVEPMIRPWKMEEWPSLSNKAKFDQLKLRYSFRRYVRYLNKTGGIDKVVAAQRARDFFGKWLSDYGDDSIAELGSAHLCIEGCSNIVANDIETQRIGLSPLEKSTRYVDFTKTESGKHPYVVPGEIKGTEVENDYVGLMDDLFSLYGGLKKPYLAYIKQLFPKGEDESDESFRRTRSAARFDHIRDLFPMSIQTNIAIQGNGRAFENLVNRLLGSDAGESRWWGQQICRELSQEVPSFMKRPSGPRGSVAQEYRRDIVQLRQTTSPNLDGNQRNEAYRSLPYIGPWVSLLRMTSDPEVEVLASFYQRGRTNVSKTELVNQFRQVTMLERGVMLKKILDARFADPQNPNRNTDRFNKPPRAFESVSLDVAFTTRAGDYRDLQRHRMMSSQRALFTTRNGYDLEAEFLDSPFISQVSEIFYKAAQVHQKICEVVSPEVAQYAVPMAFLQKWSAIMTARELYWIVELRTGPQGRPHYRKVCQDLARAAIEVAPSIFSGLMTDWKSYDLSRREAETKAARKRGEI
ncbi:MAG: FAD-dependent thymidylate synthase [Candidatus Roizmanbacteria bacterium]